MPVVRDWCRNRETAGVQSAHESIFFEGGELGHVQPGGGGAVAEVVAVGFDAAEGDAAKPVDLQDHFAFVVGWVRIHRPRS